jgi:tetratricopeptide (TPR) repeat protein
MSIVNEALKKVTREEKWVPQAEGRKFTFSARHLDRNKVIVISTLSILSILLIGFLAVNSVTGPISNKRSVDHKTSTPITGREPNQTRANLTEDRDTAPNIANEVSRLNKDGLELYRAKRLNEAKEVFQRVINIQPENAVAHNNLGLIYMEEGKGKEAEIRYKVALKANPNYPQALNNLALLYSKEGSYEEAIRLYKNALKIDPYYPEAHLNMAILLERSGYIEEAKKHYNSFVEYGQRKGQEVILKVKNHLINLS